MTFRLDKPKTLIVRLKKVLFLWDRKPTGGSIGFNRKPFRGRKRVISGESWLPETPLS